jgi:hypothetical protein
MAMVTYQILCRCDFLNSAKAGFLAKPEQTRHAFGFTHNEAVIEWPIAASV